MPQPKSPLRPRILQSFRRESLMSNKTTKSSVSAFEGGENKKEAYTVETQTDWSWIQDMQLIERIRRGLRSEIDFFLFYLGMMIE